MLKSTDEVINVPSTLDSISSPERRPSGQVCRILWAGEDQQEFGWLQSRLLKYRSSTSSTHVLPWPSLQSVPLAALENYLSETAVDRLLVACRNRWDYPQQQLEQLAIAFPEIPVAVVLGDWLMGWRRTGAAHLQCLPYLTMPWYRWWDGWQPWLEGVSQRMYGPFPQDRYYGRSKPQLCQLGATESMRLFQPPGLILTGCAQTEEAWRMSLKAGEPFHGLSDPPTPKWILWDDSRLSSWRDWSSSLDTALAELLQLRQRFPAAQLWTAWSLPTWEIVERLQRAKIKTELLAKPHWLCFSSAADART